MNEIILWEPNLYFYVGRQRQVSMSMSKRVRVSHFINFSSVCHLNKIVCLNFVCWSSHLVLPPRSPRSLHEIIIILFKAIIRLGCPFNTNSKFKSIVQRWMRKWGQLDSFCGMVMMTRIGILNGDC
jgi:hypothetical protein